jgi:hypothetical protein
MAEHDAQRPAVAHGLMTDPLGRGETCLFLQEGEYWTIIYDGRVVRVRDGKGLHYLARLLRHPCELCAATELVAAHDPSGDSVADPERARMSVSKAIRGVISRIDTYHPSLAHHLRSCIKTGYQCAYLPDPQKQVTWLLE